MLKIVFASITSWSLRINHASSFILETLYNLCGK